MKLPSKLDLLEVYCEEDSTLTKMAEVAGFKVMRFTRQDDDLSAQGGRDKLSRIVTEMNPKHICTAPECKPWGSLSRWNSGCSPVIARKI